MEAAYDDVATQQQIVLICVGLVGSGKSTFAEALQTYFPRFVRCNQDDLGDRRAVEALARSSLQQRYSVCIDRTNFDASQRATWIRIAREFPGALVWVLVFDTPPEVCERRLISRTSHPTITSAEQGVEVLRRFMSQYRAPQAWEGFDQMLSLSISDQPSAAHYSPEDVERILTRLQQAPRISPSVWNLERARGTGRGQYRGYGYGGRGGYNPRGYSRQQYGNW